ncbi:hypothetical protein ACUH7Y_15920 [Clostridium beijerinckii]|uniref:Uncharacterized protein n=1 Tax=Clostridium beijerinckii TaxID=1520 RepID=A0A1S8RZW7_CLOBE|nr:hypothetical protein [Clostridium beijerinckii]NMF03685.1 hypothetical protein [Clostridium beijerinckii]NRT86875.1 hypothetical protein [Clostridium beijerinckii]NRY64135.1 hypothetical protein [Clostridium beijerinckii]NYC72306.1 hypothetical protein [Clostridium beijerinckii]OOM58565.1 hypothetical protein CLBCK_39850 [Clostridium beijerinckii]
MNTIPFLGQVLSSFFIIVPIVLGGLSIYALILLIKALQIYINKNS